jgi:thiamine biosynthesis protein ThiI
MLELAMLCAQENGCEGIITGDNLGQVATQTLHNLATLSAGVDIPIYRPLIGYDKEEIITLARKIGTFALDSGDTSCAVLPSRPVTKSEVGRINTLMDELDLRSVFGDLLRSSRKIMVRNGIVKEG